MAALFRARRESVLFELLVARTPGCQQHREISESDGTVLALQPLRAALGCPNADDRAEQLFADYLTELTHGRLLLRVIHLCHERLIPPGDTAGERQARMDRWLPPSWSYDEPTRTLSWLRPTRFASLRVHVEVRPGERPLLVGGAPKQ